MTAAAVTDSPGDTLAEAASKMWKEQTGSLLVMEGNQLRGIVTERDVLREIGLGRDPKNISLSDVMTRDVVTIPADTSLKEAAEIMFQKWFRHLPVASAEGNVVGIISLRDLLTIVAEGMKEPDTLQPLLGHQLVRDARTDRLQKIEAGDLD